MPLVTAATPIVRKQFRTKNGKLSKKPKFYPQEVIDTTVDQMNLSIKRGVAKSQVINNTWRKMGVHRTTVENWLNKQHLKDKKVTKKTRIVTKQAKNGVQSMELNKYGVHAITFKHEAGFHKMNVNEMKNVKAVSEELF
jgi:hypothetical protein